MALYNGIKLPGHPDLLNIQKLDLSCMPMVAKMQQLGMAIDVEWMQDLTTRLTTEMDALRYDIISYIPPEKLDEFIGRATTDTLEAGMPMNVNSRDELSTLLFDVLGVGAGRSLKTTKSGSRISTGKKQMEQLKQVHPVVPKCLLYAELSKLRGTYTIPMPKKAKLHPRGPCWCGLSHSVESTRVHCQILTTRTDTRRLATKSFNLQNIPVRTWWGREVRKGFIAPDGMELVSVDFSQAEMRIGGHYSRDKNLMRIFMEGLDPHTDTAMRSFNKTKEEVESKEGKMLYRAPCKNVNFGVFYGLSGPGLYDLMAITYATANLALPDWLTLEWCEDFIDGWFNLYPGVKEYIEQQYYRARRYGIVWTLFGGVRRVPEVRSVHQRVQAAGLRQAANMPVQGTVADMCKLVMAEVDPMLDEIRNSGVWVWPLMQIHDELLFEVQEGYGEMVKEMVVDRMQNVLTDRESGERLCRIPITADGHTMKRWEKN